MNYWDERVEKLSIASAASIGRDHWPLLYFASQSMNDAYSTKVEWLADLPEGRAAEYNYTQISRTPFADTGDQIRNEQLCLHLDGIESTLWDGQRESSAGPPPRGMCGGVEFFLGRPPRTSDRIEFRPLVGRELLLLKDRGWQTAADVISEFLSEFSLLVVAGDGSGDEIHRPRKTYPLPKAWHQGEALRAA